MSGAGCRRLRRERDAAGGAVIPVDANARCPDRAQRARRRLLLAREGQRRRPRRRQPARQPAIVTPSVKYIVVVGDDAACIPFGRILDNTAYANERGYASTFFGTTNNQYLSTYGLGFLPTDDPLGDVNYSGQGPYVPELAVGRLVETPTADHQPDQPVHHPERGDQPDEGADDRLRLPHGRRDADLGGLQGEGWATTTRRS